MTNAGPFLGVLFSLVYTLFRRGIEFYEYPIIIIDKQVIYAIMSSMNKNKRVVRVWINGNELHKEVKVSADSLFIDVDVFLDKDWEYQDEVEVNVTTDPQKIKV